MNEVRYPFVAVGENNISAETAAVGEKIEPLGVAIDRFAAVNGDEPDVGGQPDFSRSSHQINVLWQIDDELLRHAVR